jgi:hypothetical protein
VIWWVDGGRKGRRPQPIRVVWLIPPDSWHLETCGDGFESGDYKVKALGAKKARLDMRFEVVLGNQKRREVTKMGKTMQANTGDHWKLYAKFLERDYRTSRTS